MNAADENAGIIAALLPKATGMGAYNLGVLSSLAMHDRVSVPREIYEKAMVCMTVEDVEELYADWRQGD